MEQLIIIALALSSVSFTVSTTSMFKWLRDLVTKIGGEDFIHCPYCLSHWILLTMYIFFPTEMIIPLKVWVTATMKVTIHSAWMFMIASYFATICMSGLFHYVLLRAYEPVAIAKLKRMLSVHSGYKDKE